MVPVTWLPFRGTADPDDADATDRDWAWLSAGGVADDALASSKDMARSWLVIKSTLEKSFACVVGAKGLNGLGGSLDTGNEVPDL